MTYPAPHPLVVRSLAQILLQYVAARLTSRLWLGTKATDSGCYDSGVATHESGRFITIEGLDGCGKSTQLARLAESLRRQGVDVVVTREPGGTEIGERIRSVLLDSRTRGLSPWAELSLMFASRAQQIDELILPAIAAGRWVLCDRFTDSSEAYQGGGRKLGIAPILDLHRVVCRGLQPDMTILMDSDVAHSVNRARRRNQQACDSNEPNENRFEQENRAFFERVQQAYLAIARREPERVFMVDARRPADLVEKDIYNEVQRRLMPASKAEG